jgi:uncharacterized glyoxalase superfamily protein PhnB
MNIIPLVHCKNMQTAINWYTQTLDFGVNFTTGAIDPSFTVLYRQGAYLHLSSHTGDGVYGTAFSIIVTDIDELFTKFKLRGLKSSKPDSPVHQGPLDQTWGTREFYAEDPDGNTARFIQYPR